MVGRTARTRQAGGLHDLRPASPGPPQRPPQDVAHAIVALLENGFITGVVLPCDAGCVSPEPTAAPHRARRRPGRRQLWLDGWWVSVVGILRPLPLAPELDRAALIGFAEARQLTGKPVPPTTRPRPRDAVDEQLAGHWRA